MNLRQDTISLVMLSLSVGLFVAAFADHILLPFALACAIASQVTGRKTT